eukprot:7001654-Pyramimonas_sp.AAC.1
MAAVSSGTQRVRGRARATALQGPTFIFNASMAAYLSWRIRNPERAMTRASVGSRARPRARAKSPRGSIVTHERKRMLRERSRWPPPKGDLGSRPMRRPPYLRSALPEARGDARARADKRLRRTSKGSDWLACTAAVRGGRLIGRRCGANFDFQVSIVLFCCGVHQTQRARQRARSRD